jgi:hypothetical protein
MIRRFESLKAHAESDLAENEKTGRSPGGVSIGDLSVSRQTIHAWVNAGILDYVMIYENGREVVCMVTDASVDRLLKLIRSGEVKLGQGGGRYYKNTIPEALAKLRELYPGMYPEMPKGLFAKGRVRKRDVGL